MAKGTRGGRRVYIRKDGSYKGQENSADYKSGYDMITRTERSEVDDALFDDKNFTVENRQFFLKQSDGYHKMATEQFLATEVDRLRHERKLLAERPLNLSTEDFSAGVDKAYADRIKAVEEQIKTIKTLRG